MPPTGFTCDQCEDEGVYYTLHYSEAIGRYAEQHVCDQCEKGRHIARVRMIGRTKKRAKEHRDSKMIAAGDIAGD